MRTVIQRVNSASVHCEGQVSGAIEHGLCCLVGVEVGDTQADIDYTAQKICSLRLFDDENGVMNYDVGTAGGDILLISQFTLLADARKGRRPSYSRAQNPREAKASFENLIAKLRTIFSGKVATGVFQAHMDVHIENNGPVTILLDSRKNF